MEQEKDKIIQAILVKPGQDPEVCTLPEDEMKQTEAISDLLDGNIGSTEFFDLGNGASLYILVNDLSVPLGLVPNRRFPDKDQDEIIFGNAIFIAAYNERSGQTGTVDMPEKICRMFIEQIKLNFVPCKGDEKPDAKTEIYIEHQGTPEERSFKWCEVEKPARTDQFIQAGRARLIRFEEQEVLEINGRYFKQITVAAKKSLLN